MITKQQAIQHFGNSTKLAKALGITKGAVSQWKEIPEYQLLRLRYEVAPELFKGKAA